MKRAGLLLVAALLAGACTGATVASPSLDLPDASIPDVLNPSSAAEMAELWCPADLLAECQDAVTAAFAAAEPAAVCVFLDGSFAIVEPNPGDTAGSPCGEDGTGTVRGVVIQP